MIGAQRRSLPGGRWHFQHGPIDCVIGADGEPGALAQALDAAWTRFQGVLDELVAELPLLRANLAAAPGHDVAVQRPIAQRMVAACRPYAAQGRFITAMAGVAGSVAQELIAHFMRPGVQRAYVNNGGDIALHLSPGESFDVGLVIDPGAAARGIDGRFRIDAASGVRGIATSGWRGRSLSLGIADSVTVLAATAAQADAAATLIANAVNLDDRAHRPCRRRRRTRRQRPGQLPATVDVPDSNPPRRPGASRRCAQFAESEIATGRIARRGVVPARPGRRCAAWGFHGSQVAAPGPILELAPHAAARALAGA